MSIHDRFTDADIISRHDALAAGRKRFYTGRECVHGHKAQRFVTTGGCVACNTARSKLFQTRETSQQGKFVYALHPGDFAAARAYCQALDLQRGRRPSEAQEIYEGPSPEAIDRAVALAIDDTRDEVLRQYGPKSGDPYLPKP